jgi:hypothetical protein
MVLSLVVFVFAVQHSAANAQPAFGGSWVGTLEYRDYSDNSLVKLGTLLRITQPKGTADWVFRYVYDDGPKKVVQDSDTISLDWTKRTYVVTSEDGKEIDPYKIDRSGLKADGTGTLILSGEGTENQITVEVRTTIKITRDHLDILRETRPKGQEFKFRHEYSFARVAAL